MTGPVLIIGGGVAGMSCAIALRARGIEVTLIDSDPGWRSYGAGISVTGLSLRAFDHLGVLDAVRQRGHVGAGLRGRAVDGSLLFDAPVPPDPQPIDSGGGIMRPVLHDILATRVRGTGARVRLGVKATRLENTSAGVDVQLSDGHQQRFELVVAADGIYSETRNQLFPDAVKPKFTGQGCWRAVAPRPVDVDRTELFFGGPVKVGINPVSSSQIYAFVLEHVPHHPHYQEQELVPHLRKLLVPYGGSIAQLRDQLGPESLVNYRPLEWHLQPGPWYRNRVVLIGDAAHATTPHLALGAGIAIEDSLVLAEELAARANVAAALDAFMVRRLPRSKLVVETSVRIGEIEMAGGDQREANQLLGATMAQLRQPY